MTMSRAAGPARRTPIWMMLSGALAAVTILVSPVAAFASELDLKIPALDTSYTLLGAPVSGVALLMAGLGVCVVGLFFRLSVVYQGKGGARPHSKVHGSALHRQD